MSVLRPFFYLPQNGSQGFVIDAIEIMVIAFVLEDVAVSFDLGPVGKGVIGSASFLGETIERVKASANMCLSSVSTVS